MKSLTDHKFSVFLTGLLLITGLGGIPTAFAASEDPGLTTTEVEATPSADGANHGGGDHNLKVYGADLWDLTESNGDAEIRWTQNNDLGNDNEFDGTNSDHFDSVLFEPAYVENGADGDSAEHLLTDLSLQYRPSYWAPASDSVEPGTPNALLDIENDGDPAAEFNPDFIFDEDVDSGIDDDSTDDAIDLLGTEDNIPDYSSRNADTGEGNDLYFPAFVNTYTFTTYKADHTLGSVTSGDRIQLPISGLGGQAGVNSYSAAKKDTEVVVQNVDNGNDDVRLQTEDIKLTPGDKIRFWDFQATLESVSGSDDPSAAWTVHWLGDYDNPEKVGSKVTTKANEIITADTGSLSTPGDCSGNRPADPGSDNLWYLCPTTVNGQNNFVFATAGRLFSDVGATNGEQAGTILVNGALYHVTDFTYASGNLRNMEVQHVVPSGGDFELESLDLSLKGVSRGSDIPVLPPFNGDHQAVEQYDLEPNLNSHGFLRGEDGNSNGIEADGIDLKASDEDIDDRLTDRSALSVSWEASAREEGLLANREEAGSSDWSVDFQNTYPNHYAEIDTPDGTTQLVDSGLYGQLTGFDKFLFESGTDDPIQVGPNGLRLYSDTLDTANDDGDVLRPNPAIDTDADARAGGSKANVLVEPKFSYDAHTVFDQRAADVDSGVSDESGFTDGEQVDLNVLSDEESDDHTGVDDNADHNTIDENADNLFSFQGAQNNAEDQGDIYAPAISQEYTYRWLSQGSNDPTSATIAGSVTEGTTTSDTEIRLPVATETHDSEGLDSCDVGGDADCEDVIVEFYENTQLHGESSNSDVFRLESTKITLDLGERAQFFDHEVQVDSTDTSYTNPRARFSFYQVDSGGDSGGDEVGNGLDGINEGNFIGLTYDYSQATSSLVESPKQSSDLNHDDSGSPQLDYEWYVYVDTINSDSVTLNVGRLVKDAGNLYIDGQQYSVTSDDTTGSSIDSISIKTDTPVGSEAVDLVQPSINIDAISAGDTVPVLTPFNEQHDVVDTTSVDVEDNQYGAFADLGSDGDKTEQSTSERIVEASALELTVQETDTRDQQSFIYSEADANNQAVNGIFAGSDDSDSKQTGHEIDRGHDHGGFPDDDFKNRPTKANHEGESLIDTAWPNEVANKKRGFKEYVSLSFESGVGQYLFQSARIESLDAGTGDNAGANSVKWLEAGCNALQGGSDGPCVAANTASDGAKSWIAVDSSDITDFLLGTGATHQIPPEEQAETGLSNFVADSISCGTSELNRGQSVACEVTVQNTGSRSGTKSVSLEAASPGGSTTEVDSKDVTIDAGNSKTVRLTWTTTSGTELGDWSLTGVTPDDRTSSTMVTVSEETEGTPNIQVTSVSLSPSSVTVGDPVTVSGQAENTGDAAGSKTFDVLLDGDIIGSVTVSVDAGATQNYATQITPSDAGTFTVEVGGQSAQLTVNEPADDGTDDGDGDGEQPDGDGVPGFSAYALITALVSAAIVARRAREH